MAKIQRALISVFDKTGLVPFAQTLAGAGVQIISTGGTARVLREAGLAVIELGDYTGFPEMMDGRVKTLHPRVHGGLLYVRDNSDHQAAAAKHGIEPIDLVVVNLYPFEQTVAKPGVTLADAIENIDIGGPSMLRSAAKNHASVTVVMDPADYPDVAAQIQASGETTPELRQKLAARVFARTSAYDAGIATYFIKAFQLSAASEDVAMPVSARGNQAGDLPDILSIISPLAQPLRYGENPHQRAALYGRFQEFYQQIHGKALSYNNILDLTAATHLIAEFAEAAPTVAVLKHTNPCGVGQADDLRAAWEKALATDRQAPFGGVIAVNRTLDLPCAEAVSELFSEVIVAPDFTNEAAALLQKKKNLRLLRISRWPTDGPTLEARSVGADSLLLQDRDAGSADAGAFNVVTKRQPTDAETRALRFGWRVVKHVKSNAIVYAAEDRTLGVGAGQMSRVDASRLAVWKAGEAGLSLRGSAVCSDAFFPFPDGLVAAAKAGATVAVQPGGSVKDEEVIAAANEHGMAMVFTGVRHFRH